MDPTYGPDQGLYARLADLERRLKDLEVTPQLGNTSFREGSLQVLDAAATPRVVLGQLASGGYGIEVFDSTGGRRCQIDDTGFAAPALVASPRDPALSKICTSAGFTQMHQSVWGEVYGPGVECWVGWSTGFATTGEVQLSVPGGNTSSAFTLPAASAGNLYIRWLHGLAVGTVRLAVLSSARRTAGAADVNIFPMHGWVTDPAGCSAAGILA